MSVEVNLRVSPERYDPDEHDQWTGFFIYEVASKLAGTFICGWVCRYADQQMT